GDTPLHVWILFNHANYLEEALKLGANPNMRSIKTENEFSFSDAGKTYRSLRGSVNQIWS
ncbi:hypothetical protein J7D62_001609, partial [Campylobacter lari]|nr:hypothetical protein [Campylobacter lari]EAH7188542.1 hypothetical protein [Campylobacter lari]EAI1583571.1 hypothetical protein [Campylobacter lari]EEP1957812.1 hypothetical protein [Campylobacter lari]EGK7495753.1 hypothetical protein [Campylobacter lari]